MNRVWVLSVACILYWTATLLYADPLTNLITGDTESDNAPKAEKVIEVDNSIRDDKKIRKRLVEIFSELEDLHEISVSVNSGIVTLTGNVSASTTKTKASQLSQQVKGVVEVENELVVTHDLKKRLDNTWQKFKKTSSELIARLPLILLALVVLVASWILGRWISRRHKLFNKLVQNYFLASLIGQISYFVIFLAGLITALSLLDLSAILGTILGAAGIVGLAIGFAVRDTVENYIASILLSLRNPFEVNDVVDIDGILGNVVRLTTRATILISPDGNFTRIPNSTVFKAVIINFSRNKERRFQFDIGIDMKQDLLQAQALALKTLSSIEGILQEPRPTAFIEEINNSNIKLRFYGWINQSNNDFQKVRSEAIRGIKEAYDQSGIIVSEPTYQVKVLEDVSKGLARANNIEQKNKAENMATQTSAHIHAVTDTSSDKTIEKKVTQEQSHDDSENLLNKKTELE